MTLGDFIHQNLEKKALPGPVRSALSATIPSLLTLYLPPYDSDELAQSIEDYLRTEDFASAISNAVGEPKSDETEDQFVSRAKSAIEEILTRRFNE
jgi:hypothetical protein